MPVFEYIAKSSPTEIIKGKIETSSKEGVVSQLNEKGLYPLSIKEIGKSEDFDKTKIKISGRWLVFFTREIADLLNSGVNLIDALKLIGNQSHNKKLHFITKILHDRILDGASFSEALSHFPSLFSPLYINVTKSGEVSGQLEEVLQRLARFYENNQTLKSKIIEALMYPLFLLIMGIGAVSVLVIFVIPKLKPIFESMDTALPLPTQIVLFISQSFHSYWLIILILSLILSSVFMRIKQSEKWISKLHEYLLIIPVIKEFLMSQHLAEIFQSLESLISNGVATVQALEIASESCSFYPYKKHLLKMAEAITNGDSMSMTVHESKLFPERIHTILKVGEESGHIEIALRKLAASYIEAFEVKAKILTKMIGPLFIILIGVVVALIIVAMLLPIMSLNMGF